MPITPSTHRQRVGDPTGIGLSTIPGLVVGTPRSPRNQMNPRVPLANVSSNHFRGGNATIPTTRMSSGLKVGQGGDGSGGLVIGSSKPRGKISTQP
jgi:E3 ubiquitin-protein ligase CCNP1IP1